MSTGTLPRVERAPGRTESVVQLLGEQIRAGAWPVGTRIPPDGDLASMTGTSRTTVREAVQALVHSGLLQRRQGLGTFVRATNEVGSSLHRLLGGAQRGHARDLRQGLEVGLARLAARRRTRDDVVVLTDLVGGLERALREDRLEVAADLDLALRRSIAAAAHNPVLADLYEPVLVALGSDLALCEAGTAAAGVSVVDGHRRVVAAVVAGDDAAAEAAVRRR